MLIRKLIGTTYARIDSSVSLMVVHGGRKAGTACRTAEDGIRDNFKDSASRTCRFETKSSTTDPVSKVDRESTSRSSNECRYRGPTTESRRGRTLQQGTSGASWVIALIDGTRSYVYGYPPQVMRPHQAASSAGRRFWMRGSTALTALASTGTAAAPVGRAALVGIVSCDAIPKDYRTPHEEACHMAYVQCGAPYRGAGRSAAGWRSRSVATSPRCPCEPSGRPFVTSSVDPRWRRTKRTSIARVEWDSPELEAVLARQVGDHACNMPNQVLEVIA